MTQRSHPRSFPDKPARPHHLGWRSAARIEWELIRAWFRSGMSRGLEWLLELGVPTAATVLEMENVKRRNPEIEEIEQAVRSARAHAHNIRPIAPTADRPPFDN